LYALLNAVKAMGRPEISGRPKGKLRIASRVEAPAWVLVEIEDNGLGIADTTLQRVLDPVLGSQNEDTGQALAHARAVIVDEHQGRLEIRSSPEGTSLTIRLPLDTRFAAAVSEAEVDDESAWS
jgi:signal transduction histidine kinase